MKDFEMTEIKTVKVGNIEFANDKPFAILAGPCAIESRQHALEMSAALKELSEGMGIGLVYKSSFDKANRTSSTSKRGVGLVEGLDILAEVKEKIASLLALEAELERMVEGCSHGRVETCQVIEILADHGKCRHHQHEQ